MSKLQAERKQSSTFGSLQQETFFSLTRTAGVATHQVEQRLRGCGVSVTQYNVLRILRHAGEQGLIQTEIGERLVAQVPDVPRILGRMAKVGWVQRVRGEADRRTISTSLTAEGAKLVNSLQEIMLLRDLNVFSRLSEDELHQLCGLLELARGGACKVQE